MGSGSDADFANVESGTERAKTRGARGSPASSRAMHAGSTPGPNRGGTCGAASREGDSGGVGGGARVGSWEEEEGGPEDDLLWEVSGVLNKYHRYHGRQAEGQGHVTDGQGYLGDGQATPTHVVCPAQHAGVGNPLKSVGNAAGSKAQAASRGVVVVTPGHTNHTLGNASKAGRLGPCLSVDAIESAMKQNLARKERAEEIRN